MQDQEIQALIDERKIYKVLARYCIGADRRDAEMMRDCYWPEGIDDHGITPPLNAYDFVDMAVTSDIINTMKRTLHTLGQVSYDIKDNIARVESYIISYHRVVNEPAAIELLFGETYNKQHEDADCDGHDFMVGGRYLDVFEKRGDDWRIIRRLATGEWEFSRPASKVMSEGLFKTAHGADAVFLD